MVGAARPARRFAIDPHRPPSPRLATHQSLPASHAFLISGRPGLEIERSPSQQTRKHFLVASISAVAELGSYRANHGSRGAPFLFDPNEQTRETLTRSQPTRKHFLSDTFERHVSFVFDILARSFAFPMYFDLHQSPVATVELPAYDQ
jgi:hypothetical protein